MKYTLSDFIPLIAILAVIIGFVALRQSMMPFFDSMAAMNDFMAGFFLVFGAFKLLNLHGFAEAYRIYDVVAQRSILYAYAYPFIEIGLGVFYLLRLFPVATNIFTLIIMLISALGVAIELSKGKQIMCACLGVVFKLPMTYVTLLEDLLMAFMAAYMLFNLL